MGADRAVTDLELFLAERGEPLLRTAILLAGSRDAGEDLLQASLERLLRRWRTIEGDPEGYLRRTLYHLAADNWRQQRAWRKRLRLLQSGAGAAVVDGTDEVDRRGSSGHVRLWVNRATYLPMRLETGGLQTDFQWLRPTPAHQAMLNMPVPAGFRHVIAPS